ncbi:NAD(+) diphosphatase [Neptuniibacter halophilus]|uniref:NAD(+) diphosphatase n=1 Tax=Neptuniibacter halophilus TaxID=651666 RepID=UPI002573F12E|nr:NAD(+) diphosphatase [Neptuniibacter halophilus]
MSESNTEYLLACQERLLGTEQGVIRCTAEQLADLDVEVTLPLGLITGQSLELAILRSKCLPDGVNREQLLGLRSLLGGINTEAEYVMLSSAAQIAIWYESFRYCPRCATPLSLHKDEMAKVCTGCGHHQYPRISPCIIVLVRDGERCLLANAAKFNSDRYSTLAGFIEAGESAESAVAREVMEEVGIEVKNIEYCFSQSWPFPHSFMLGFMADYAAGELRPDGVEILDAQWFSVDDLPNLPPKFTIARRLIDRFFAEQGVELDSGSALFFPAE